MKSLKRKKKWVGLRNFQDTVYSVNFFAIFAISIILPYVEPLSIQQIEQMRSTYCVLGTRNIEVKKGNNFFSLIRAYDLLGIINTQALHRSVVSKHKVKGY